MVQSRRPPSQTWRTFLANHAKDLVSADCFMVPTVYFRVLFVFMIVSHDRRWRACTEAGFRIVEDQLGQRIAR
jgi:hypothetical protein